MTRELMALRPYQREAIDAVTGAWKDGMRRPAVVLPTGMGKTVVFSHMIAERHAATGQRSVVLVHRDELADQAVNKLRAVAPHLLVGKVKAARDEIHADLVVASVPTLASERRLTRLLDSQARFGRLGLWVTDECHHAISPSYGRVYAATREADHVGFTATLARSDNKGLGSVWDDVVSSKTIAYAVKNGYLVRPVGRSVKVPELDLNAVGKSRGDYAEGQLGDALEDSKALEIAADAYAEHAADRSGIAFTPTVATAQHLAALLTQRGIPAAVVHGGTPRTERLAIYEAFRIGSIRVLCNCMVLTEGFDAPWASAALIVRPTQSNPLYIQMVGRVLRPFPGKADALVIDVVGASQQNKLQTLIDLEEGLWKQAEACEECGCLPCECICTECGKPKKPKCDCPSTWVPPVLQAAGTGAALDLFAASESAWGQTPGGIWFIGCGPAGYVFLWPNGEGTWDVCVAPLRGGTALRFQRTDYRAMPIEAAMTWAEAEAEDVGAVLARKSARWRKSPATDKQTGLARRYGIVVPAGATKGDVSDLIDTAKAASIFDRYVGASL